FGINIRHQVAGHRSHSMTLLRHATCSSRMCITRSDDQLKERVGNKRSHNAESVGRGGCPGADVDRLLNEAAPLARGMSEAIYPSPGFRGDRVLTEGVELPQDAQHCPLNAIVR